MNRREFIEKSCFSSLAVVFGGSVLTSLDIPSVKAASRSGADVGIREIPIMLEDTPELQQVGGAYRLEIIDLDKDILIVRTDAESYVAVDIKCTHKGCLVAYKQEMEKPAYFECPCHGSKYDMEGNPTTGPAKNPLGSYRTEIKDGELLVMVPIEDESSPAVDSTK